MVDLVIGPTDGRIPSEGAFAALLDYALEGHGLDAAPIAGGVVFDIDKTLYPNAGSRAYMRIGSVSDNLGPAPYFDILDVDITDPANDLDNYLLGVDAMMEKVISGASTLWSASNTTGPRQMLALFCAAEYHSNVSGRAPAIVGFRGNPPSGMICLELPSAL